MQQAGFKAEKHWGDLIDDRDRQITFSALGQAAPLDEKEKWDPDFAKRKAIEAILAPLIPAFSIHLGGSTSIDVTRRETERGHPTISLPEKNCAISAAAVSGASEPWTEFSPIDRAKSLRIVPAAAFSGLVAPITVR